MTREQATLGGAAAAAGGGLVVAVFSQLVQGGEIAKLIAQYGASAVLFLGLVGAVVYLDARAETRAAQRDQVNLDRIAKLEQMLDSTRAELAIANEWRTRDARHVAEEEALQAKVAAGHARIETLLTEWRKDVSGMVVATRTLAATVVERLPGGGVE